jgi:hypothetical protein
MEDPINARFFAEELSPFEKDWLNACRDSVMAFRMLVPAQMTIHGVQESSAQPYISEPSILKSMNENCKVLSEEYKQRLKTDRVKQQKAASDEVERLRAQLRETDVQPLQDTAGLQSLRELFLSEPEKYVKHKTKLDQLYQQYYRAVDTLRQLTNDGAAYGQIVEQYRESADIHRHLAQTAYQKQMEAEAQCQLIRQQMEAMSDLMGYYLGGSLTQAAQAQEEEGRRKVAERLDNITFTENPLPLQGLEPVAATSIYTRYKQAGIEKNTLETERLELKDTLLNSDMAPHLENSLENASGVKFSGLVGMRLATH